MAAPTRTSFVRAFGAGLVALLVAGVNLVALAPPSHAEQDSGLDVAVQTIAPLIPRPGSTLKIAGQITNITDRPAEAVVVRLRLGTTPLRATDRQQVDQLIDEVTTRATATDREPATRTITAWTPVTASLAAGAQQSFSVSVPVDALQLGDAGVYVVGVEAFARSTADGDNLAGIQRSLWPWFPPDNGADPQIKPDPQIKVAWLWPLVSAPAWNENDELLNDELPRALAPQGRLTNLLDIGARYPNLLTWIADPALLQMVATMRDGYLVKTATGSTPGEGADDATSWLDRLQTVLANVQASTTGQQRGALHLVPYASIDASAARRAELGPDVVQAVTMGPTITSASVGVASADTVYWAPGGLLDRQTAGLLASAGTRYVIVDPPKSDSGASTAAVRPFAPSVPGLLAVIPDSAVQQVMTTSTGDAESVLLARQAFLAHTALTSQLTGELVLAPPLMGGNPRVLAALLRATALAPWIDAVPLSAIPVGPSRGGFTYGSTGRESELPATYLDRVRQTQLRLDRFAAILADPTAIVEDFTQALLRAQSAAWRAQPLVGEELLTSVAVDLDERRAGIEVLNGRTVTLSGDSGRIPVTVVNNLDQSVSIGLRLVSDPKVRLNSDIVATLTIAPGRTTSVDIPVRVAGSEPLRVSVQVLTPNGTVFRTAPVGTVYSAAYARAASWVVGAAFIAILLFVLVGITRRLLTARRSATTPPDGTLTSKKSS